MKPRDTRKIYTTALLKASMLCTDAIRESIEVINDNGSPHNIELSNGETVCVRAFPWGSKTLNVIFLFECRWSFILFNDFDLRGEESHIQLLGRYSTHSQCDSSPLFDIEFISFEFSFIFPTQTRTDKKKFTLYAGWFTSAGTILDHQLLTTLMQQRRIDELYIDTTAYNIDEFNLKRTACAKITKIL